MIGTKLKNRWLSQGLEVNPGVSEEKLSQFESRYHVSLPADLRDYFLTVDGMAEGISDDALISFWSLNKVKPIPEEAPAYAARSYIEEAESLFVFADYSIWAHAYAIRLSSSSGNANPVIVIGGEKPVKVFDSFSDLVSSYLINPDNLLTNVV
jgi:SMI1/KNR4 family protein SUKH-1